MGLSRELQIGKAGEHLVCCDLILQGYNAFLADQGLPFDVVVERQGELKKIQVRSTLNLYTIHRKRCYTNGEQQVYRFGLRRGKRAKYNAKEIEVDYYAFVALDIREIAYLHVSLIKNNKNTIKSTVDFKTKRIQYTGRTYSNGAKRQRDWGKYFEDYEELKW